MEIVTMGKGVVSAKIENLQDVLNAQAGALRPEVIRFVEVPDAVVDTGATMLSLPRRIIKQLGLIRTGRRQARTAAGLIQFGVYAPVRLTVQDRECDSPVAEVPDDCPVLIGQIPLEMLDFVIDPVGRKLIGNPEHGGEQMIDLL